MAKVESAGDVVKAGVICYALAALLNSSSLVKQARALPEDSGIRGVAVSAAETTQSVADLFGFTVPVERLDAWRGRSAEGAKDFGFEDLAPAPDELPAEGTPSSLVPTDTSIATTTTVVVTTTRSRTPSATNKLRVYIAGDSLVQGWGQSLQRQLGATGIIDAPVVDYKAATGLARPDVYDWPGRLQAQVKVRKPDVVVVGFGGNDAQALIINSKPYGPSDAVWQAEYATRVAATMAYLRQDKRAVIWVGTPMPRDARDFANQDVLNRIYREAATTAGVVFVDAWQLFAGADGGYGEYIADDDGETKLMRQNDGFHLSITGSNRLARAIFAKVADDVRDRGGNL